MLEITTVLDSKENIGCALKNFGCELRLLSPSLFTIFGFQTNLKVYSPQKCVRMSQGWPARCQSRSAVEGILALFNRERGNVR